MKSTVISLSRYMMYIFVSVAVISVTSSCSDNKTADNADKDQSEISNLNQSDELKGTEQGNDWKLLSSGTEAWRSTDGENFPEQGWTLENGILAFVPVENGHGGGSIITKKKYTNFELSLDFKIEEGGNSGIKYNVVDNYPGYEGNYLGLEYQILDDERHPDAKKGRDGNRTIASLYDMIPASDDKKVRPEGEWNHARIIKTNNQCEHWLNGEKVVSFTIGSPEYRELVDQSKYNIYENFGEIGTGHILLQAHGNPVSFRNVRIRVPSEG